MRHTNVLRLISCTEKLRIWLICLDTSSCNSLMGKLACGRKTVRSRKSWLRNVRPWTGIMSAVHSYVLARDEDKHVEVWPSPVGEALEEVPKYCFLINTVIFFRTGRICSYKLLSQTSEFPALQEPQQHNSIRNTTRTKPILKTSYPKLVVSGIETGTSWCSIHNVNRGATVVVIYKGIV